MHSSQLSVLEMMVIHSLLPVSCGISGACHGPSLSISTQPVPDHLGSPPCSTLRSSHSEILSTEMVLRDLVANHCHGVQEKHLKDDDHEVSEHSVRINNCKNLNFVNGKHVDMICMDAECIDSNGSACLPRHSPTVSKVPNMEDPQYLDLESHFRSSEQECKNSLGRSLRVDLEAQAIAKDLAFIEAISDEPLPTNIFIPILKKCREHKLLAPAKRLHLHMCKHGFEMHGVLRNFLVTIYVDNGCINEARQLVNQLDNVDLHCWNTLIQGYLDSGESKQAFRIYKEMEAKLVPSRRYILMALLRAFASQRCIKECWELHAKIVERELESDRFFCNTLIDMYVKCDSLVDAQEVFNEHSCKDVVLFSTLIIGYNDRGHFEDVLRCWDQLVLEGLVPDVPTLVCSLKACASIHDLDKGQELHTIAVKQMLEEETSVGNCLVAMYAKCGALSDSVEVFDKLPTRDVVSWSSLIAGYADHGFGEKALKLFDQMKLSGILPNDVTFLSVLKACISTGAVEKGLEIHTEIIVEEYESYPLVSSALVDMYSKFGLHSEARFLFDKLPVRNVITWTSIIEAYAEHGRYGKAFRCFQQMQSEGILPNRVTLLCVLKACCNRGLIGRGRNFHSEIIMRGFEGDMSISSTLVDMYAKCGSPAEAQFMFDRLPSQCVIPWTALIAGYVRHGQTEEAFYCFEQMKEKGILPEDATYLYILKACGDENASELGQIIHMELIYRGFERRDRLGSAIVYMYSKNALLAEGQSVFDSLQSPDIASWRILMHGFADQRLCDKALDFLERMDTEGVPSDVTTWTLCMEACKCTGLINKVYNLHLQIVKRGFEGDPSIGHLILDTYAFHGFFEEAKAVFNRLPDCDSAKWSTLISNLC